jgi:outer membrane protein assembly factor BamB
MVTIVNGPATTINPLVPGETYTATAACSTGTLIGGGMMLTGTTDGLGDTRFAHSIALDATTWEVAVVVPANHPFADPGGPVELSAQAICAG